MKLKYFSIRNFALFCVFAGLTVVVACGGGGGVHSALDETSTERASLDWTQAVKNGSFAVLAVTSDERGVDSRTANLALSVEDSANGPELVVSSVDLPPSESLFLHVQYDPAEYDPRLVNQGEDIAGKALVLGITSPEDYVAIGLAVPGLESTLAGNQELVRIKFTQNARQSSRTVALPPSDPVDDLRFLSSAPETLRWTYVSPGDYDQNSEVGVSDITPIAAHYASTPESSDWQTAQVADGDGNTEVNAGDMVIIVQNYLKTITGYQVQSGEAEDGSFSDGALVQFSTAIWPDAGGFRYFEYDLGTATAGAWYVVTAVYGDEQADDHSNAVQYSSVVEYNAPAGLSATTDGTNISLHWTAPDGNTPSGYTVYIGTDEAMSSPFEITGVTDTDYTLSSVFSPDDEYYFGVKADYGGTLSDYSNIYHYAPGSGTPAPSGLVAEQNGSVIQASWTAPDGNTPMHYDVFIDNTADLSGAVLAVNDVAATTADLPTLFSPDSEWYLGVKANYSEGQSDYSNIYHYTPGGSEDTDPPTWDTSGEGIKSAVGGNASAEIQWYAATDTDSPPVVYLIYYAEHSTGIDWSTSQTTAAAGTTSLIITGLTNDTVYEFAVRAQDDSGNVTTNTNYLLATPSATSAPVDTGVWQSSELVDYGGTLISQDVGWFTDIAVADDGTIGVAHHNESAGDLLYSEQLGGTGDWTTVTVAYIGDVGQWPDLEFDPATGYPCIAYHNVDEATLEYAAYDGTEWQIETVDESTSDVGSFASLEFNPSTGYPAIAYFDAIGNDVRYANYDGSSWHISVAFNGSGNGDELAGSFCDLKFNPSTGYPAIAHRDSYEYSSMPMSTSVYTYYTGTGWNSEDACLGPYSDLGIDTAGWANSLAFDGAGNPRIICVESMGEVLVSYPTGSVWSEASVGDTGTLSGGKFEQIYTDIEYYNGSIYWLYFDMQSDAVECGSGVGTASTLEGSGNGGFPSLDVANDTLYAAYLDSTGGGLRVARKPISGGSWSYETADDGEGGEAVVGERASLAFHPTDDYPMISYYDSSNSAQKYADRQPGTWRSEIVSNTAYDGSAGGLVVQSDGTAIIGYFSVSTSATALKTATGGYGSWDLATIFETNISSGGDAKGNYCAIGMMGEPNENVGLAYHNTTQRTLEFAQIDNYGGSEITTVYEFNDPGRFNSVAYNPANNYAGIAFLARDTSDLYFVQRAGTGDWAPVAVDTGGTVGNRCSLVYGADTARPWISYYDDSNKRLKVAYVPAGEDWSGSGVWQYVTIDAPEGSADYGSYSSIAWHPEYNRAAVVFYDATNGKLWYQFIGDPDAPQAAVEITGASSKEGLWPSLKFDEATGQPAVAYFDVSNGDLRYVERAES